MDIQEVCTRLGLKDVSELAGLLDFSDRSHKIWQLTKKAVDCQNYTQIELLLEDSSLELDGSTSSPGSFYRQGWACALKSFSDEQQPKEERKKLKDPSGFPKEKIPKGAGSEWYFHRGHILAYSFAKTLTTNHRLLNSNYEWQPEVYWQKDITNKKDRNLFTQFNVANKLQGYVEQEVRELFEDGAKEIFYEVRIIKHSQNNCYAIGTEIYYKVTVPKDDVTELDEGHYFIPNLDQGFYIEDADARQLYRDFYAEGYKKEKHKKYFKDSDREQRNWQSYEGSESDIKDGDSDLSIEIDNDNYENNEFFIIPYGERKGIYNSEERVIEIVKNDIKWVDLKDISTKNSIVQNEIIKFKKDDIDIMEKKLHCSLKCLDKAIVEKRGKGKTRSYYPGSVFLEDKSAIYLSWEFIEPISSNYHEKSKSLKEAMKVQGWIQ